MWPWDGVTCHSLVPAHRSCLCLKFWCFVCHGFFCINFYFFKQWIKISFWLLSFCFPLKSCMQGKCLTCLISIFVLNFYTFFCITQISQWACIIFTTKIITTVFSFVEKKIFRSLYKKVCLPQEQWDKASCFGLPI